MNTNTSRFQIVTSEGEPVDFRDGLHEAIERAYELKQYAAWYGVSGIYVIDSMELLQSINIP